MVYSLFENLKRGLPAMKDILQQLEDRRVEARKGGGAERVAAQHSKGKLTARERIELLLDEGRAGQGKTGHRTPGWGSSETKVKSCL